VQVTFDPSEISYREILEAFFTVHDPTTMNRQGGDVGTQYRSIILYHDEEQQRIAKELIAEFEREDVFGAPIVTEVVPFKEFYPAEEYHQDYYRRNPLQPYCMFVVRPKVAKIRKALASKLRTTVSS
jgi:peptide-methionine (S)-S-oxide reductase